MTKQPTKDLITKGVEEFKMMTHDVEGSPTDWFKTFATNLIEEAKRERDEEWNLIITESFSGYMQTLTNPKD